MELDFPVLELHLPTLKFGQMDSFQVEVLISLIVGFITPWITALFNRRHFTDKERVIVGMLIAIVLGIIQSWLTGKLANVTTVMTAIGIIWQTSQVTYRNVAQKWHIRSFEIATTPADQRISESGPLSTSSKIEATAQIIETVKNQSEAVAEEIKNISAADVVAPKNSFIGSNMTEEEFATMIKKLLIKYGE